MADISNGTVEKLTIKAKNPEGYLLDKGYQLNSDESYKIGQRIDVFIYESKDKRLATTQIPQAQFQAYGWAKVVEPILETGLYVDIGVPDHFFVYESDLPALKSVWPAVDDMLYIHLKQDRKNQLFAVPAKEKEFDALIEDAAHKDLNEMISGHVIRAGKEGTVLLTDEHLRVFIHHTERRQEPRLGEKVSARIIEVKEDGSLNASLMPLKQDRMAADAEKIFAYLEANAGEIPFHNKSDAEAIKNTFGMSKSAFKRAVGKLLKEGKIKLGETSIIQNK